MKKVYMCLWSLLFTMVCMSGFAGANDDGEILIGLSLDTLKEARWQKDRDIFTAEAEKLGAKVLVQSANSDDTRQIQDIQSLITNDVDVLVIVPHDGQAMAKGVGMAADADIPVISYDRITSGDVTLWVTFDNIKVGEGQAQYLVDHLPGGKGRIVRLYGAPTDENAKLFKQGQDNIILPLVEKGDIEVVHEDWVTDWNPSNAKKVMNAAITKVGDKFDGVLASNDGTAGGAIQALKEYGLSGKVIVTGQDADEVACQRIVSGTQSMTIYKPIKKLATKVAQMAVKLAKGENVMADTMSDNGTTDVATITLPIVVVDKDNMMDTVIADGFHTEEAVYGRK